RRAPPARGHADRVRARHRVRPEPPPGGDAATEQGFRAGPGGAGAPAGLPAPRPGVAARCGSGRGSDHLVPGSKFQVGGTWETLLSTWNLELETWNSPYADLRLRVLRVRSPVRRTSVVLRAAADEVPALPEEQAPAPLRRGR